MKKLNFRNLLLTAAAIGVTTFYSCGEEEKTPAPVADFTVSVSGKAITIVNTSTDAETYAWDFGDGGTSAEMTPTHTYDANGSYVVKLTVTNESGEDDKSVALEVINIKIDGDFAEWADVPAIASYGDGEGGSLIEVKLENLSNDKLYVYIKGTTDLRGFFDIYLNTDGDVATGANSWIYPANMGADYLIEGMLGGDTKDADIFKDNAEDEGWCWTTDCSQAPVPVVSAGSSAFAISNIVTSGSNKYMEFSIDLSLLLNVSEQKIGFAINDVAEDWSYLGTLPQHGQETSELFMYTLK